MFEKAKKQNKSEYWSNMKSSIGKMSKGYMDTYMPSASSYSNEINTSFNEVNTYIRGNHSKLNQNSKRFKRYVLSAPSTMMKNMKDDLKSGKIYNDDRMDYDGYGLKSMQDNMESSYDDDTSLSSNIDKSVFNKLLNGSAVKDYNNRKEFNALSKVTLGSAEYISDTMYTLNQQNMIINSKYHNETINLIKNTNTALGNIVSFNTGIMSEHIEKTHKFYDDVLNKLDSINEKMESFYGTDKQQSSANPLMSLIDNNGVPGLMSYGKMIKNKTSVPFDSIGDMLKLFMSSPVSSILNAVIKGTTPKNAKSGMDKLNDVLSGIFATYLMGIDSLSNDGSITSMIKNTFGVNLRSNMTPNLSVYQNQSINKELEQRKAKAITEVIPSQLSEIIRSLSGKNMYYNYAKGKFEDKSVGKKDVSDRLKTTVVYSAMGESQRDFSNTIKKIDMGLSEKEGELLNKDLDNFLYYLGTIGEIFNPEKPYSYYTKKGLRLDGGIRTFRILCAAYTSMPNEKKAALRNRQIQSIIANKSIMDNESINYYTSGQSALFNGMDDNNDLYTPLYKTSSGKNKGTSNNTSKSDYSKYFESTTKRDSKRRMTENMSRPDVSEPIVSNDEFNTGFGDKVDEKVNKAIDKTKSGYKWFIEHTVDKVAGEGSPVDALLRGTSSLIYDLIYGKESGTSVSDHLKNMLIKYSKKSMGYFNKILFGETDKEGNVTKKGIFKKETTELVKKYLPKGLKGAGVGTLVGMITQHPLAGAAIGAAMNIIVSTDKVQEYLFGKKDDPEDKGIFGGIKKKIDEVLFDPLKKLIKEKILDPIKKKISPITDGVKEFFFGKKDDDTKIGVFGKMKKKGLSFLDYLKMKLNPDVAKDAETGDYSRFDISNMGNQFGNTYSDNEDWSDVLDSEDPEIAKNETTLGKIGKRYKFNKKSSSSFRGAGFDINAKYENYLSNYDSYFRTIISLLKKNNSADNITDNVFGSGARGFAEFGRAATKKSRNTQSLISRLMDNINKGKNVDRSISDTISSSDTQEEIDTLESATTIASNTASLNEKSAANSKTGRTTGLFEKLFGTKNNGGSAGILAALLGGSLIKPSTATAIGMGASVVGAYNGVRQISSGADQMINGDGKVDSITGSGSATMGAVKTAGHLSRLTYYITKLIAGIIGKIKHIGTKAVLKKVSGKLSATVAKTLLGKLGLNVAKFAVKWSNPIGWGLIIAAAVADFISGYNDIRSIMGTLSSYNPPTSLRVTCGLSKAITGLVGLDMFTPNIVGIIYPFISPEESKLLEDTMGASQSEYKSFLQQHPEAQERGLTFAKYQQVVNPTLWSKVLDPLGRHNVSLSNYTDKQPITYDASNNTTIITDSSTTGSGARGIMISGRGDNVSTINKVIESLNKNKYDSRLAKPDELKKAVDDKSNKKESFFNKIGKFFKNLFGGSGARGDSDYYNQSDPKWSNMSFGSYGGKTDTVGDGGCGPTVAAMAIQKMTGMKTTPDRMAKYALNGGFKYNNGGTDTSFFDSVGSNYGLSFDTQNGISGDAINNLRNGIPTILMGKDGRGSSPFGSGMHYVLGTGMDGNGDVNILDPQNKSNNKKFSINDVANNTYKSITARGEEGTPSLNAYENVFKTLGNTFNSEKYNSLTNTFNSFLKGKAYTPSNTSSNTSSSSSTPKTASNSTSASSVSNKSSSSTTTGSFKAVGSTPLYTAIYDKLFGLINKHEGSYSSVNANDNGSYSVGIFQWHDTNARDMFNKLANVLPNERDSQLASEYAKAYTKALNKDEANGMTAFLNSPNVYPYSVSVQNEMCQERMEKYLLKKPMEMYNNGELKDIRSTIMIADIMNSGDHFNNWKSNYMSNRGVSPSKSGELIKVKESLQSTDSRWGRETSNLNYKKGWMNIIDKSYQDLKDWDLSEYGAGSRKNGSIPNAPVNKVRNVLNTKNARGASDNISKAINSVSNNSNNSSGTDNTIVSAILQTLKTVSDTLVSIQISNEEIAKRVGSPIVVSGGSSSGNANYGNTFVSSKNGAMTSILSGK